MNREDSNSRRRENCLFSNHQRNEQFSSRREFVKENQIPDAGFWDENKNLVNNENNNLVSDKNNNLVSDKNNILWQLGDKNILVSDNLVSDKKKILVSNRNNI